MMNRRNFLLATAASAAMLSHVPGLRAATYDLIVKGGLPLARLLLQASHADRVIKGLATGDAWSALTGLTGGLAGALQATAESGRVRG